MIRITRSFEFFPFRFDGRWAVDGVRWRQQLKHAAQALGAGASTVPFGDNGDVFRALAQSRAADCQEILR